VSFQDKDNVAEEKNESRAAIYVVYRAIAAHLCWQRKKPASRERLGVKRVLKATGKFRLEETECLYRWMGLEWRKCIHFQFQP